MISLVAPIFGLDKPTEQHKRFRMTGDLVSAFDNAAINCPTDSFNPIKNHDINELLNINETIPEQGWI